MHVHTQALVPHTYTHAYHTYILYTHTNMCMCTGTCTHRGNIQLPCPHHMRVSPLTHGSLGTSRVQKEAVMKCVLTHALGSSIFTLTAFLPLWMCVHWNYWPTQWQTEFFGGWEPHRGASYVLDRNQIAAQAIRTCSSLFLKVVSGKEIASPLHTACLFSLTPDAQHPGWGYHPLSPSQFTDPGLPGSRTSEGCQWWHAPILRTGARE